MKTAALKEHYTYIIFLFVMAVIIGLLPLCSYGQVDVTFSKAQKQVKTRIYWDKGAGFTQGDSKAKKRKKKTVHFQVSKEQFPITGLRFDPAEKALQDEIGITSIALLGSDGVRKRYEGEQLAEILEAVNDIEVTTVDSTGYYFICTGDDSQFMLAPEAVEQLNRCAGQMWAAKLGIFLLLFVASLLICHRKRIYTYLREKPTNLLKTAFLLGTGAFWGSILYREYASAEGFFPHTVLLGFLLLAFAALYAKGEKQRQYSVLYILQIEIALYILAEMIYGTAPFAIAYTAGEAQNLIRLFALLAIGTVLVHFAWKKENSKAFLFLTVTFYMFRLTIAYCGFGSNLWKALNDTLHYVSTYQGMLSLLAVFGIYMVLRGIFGRGIGILLYTIVWLIAFGGNLIEMLFHETFVKPIDVFLLAELGGIAGNYINAGVVLFLVLLLGILAAAAFYFRKQLARALRPNGSAVMTVAGLMLLLWWFAGLYQNEYLDIGINKNDRWSQDERNMKKQGFAAFSYIGLLNIMNIFPEEPEGYSAEMVENILGAYENEASKNALAEQPDVVYIMLESMFDVDELREYGIDFSEDPDPTMDAYALTTTISPAYGGNTARAEFEGLTGLTDSMFPYGTVEYNTFFGSAARPMYSIVDVFKENGYEATAIHQNDRKFYNRSTVYTSMGFDKFIANDNYTYTKKDCNLDKYLKNTHYLRLITEQLESSETPQLIWGITIESHGPYPNKYESTDIEVQADQLTATAKAELTQYIQSVKATDAFVKDLIAYADNRERPTLLVFFGDHLPNLLCNGEIGLLQEPQKMFGTVCMGYANYKTLEIPEEYLSINYLAEFVVHNAGIENSAFYNYLAALRQQKPLVHNSYNTPEDEALLVPYHELQYDIMFGESYLRSRR